MPSNTQSIRRCLQSFDFKTLFIEELGWNYHSATLDIDVDGQPYRLHAIAEKCGMAVFICTFAGHDPIPGRHILCKIERQVARSIHEHLIIYTHKSRREQIWQWVKREQGRSGIARHHRYRVGQPGDSLIQKLQALAVSLDEEEVLTLPEVTGRARRAFDVERVTKRFYDRFKDEHGVFLKFIEGIPDEELERWYASVMLNRLMFVYFIQKKGFLDGDQDYLRKKLGQFRLDGLDSIDQLDKKKGEKSGTRTFYRNVLCPLFFEGFAKREQDRSPQVRKILGKVPYLNGGIFMPHQIEQIYDRNIHIPDVAFDKLFEFFDAYQWHLDERPLRADNEINPDVLGYIFEKYINQKQMGAYYTKEDITGYISKNTIVPFIFDAAAQGCRVAFEGGAGVPPADKRRDSGQDARSPLVWDLLAEDPDRYIYPAVRHGMTWDIHNNTRLEKPLELPEEIAIGMNPPTLHKVVGEGAIQTLELRKGWNKPAPADYALPTETWRELVARRKRYEEIRSKLAAGEIRNINDLITYNLDICEFAKDAIASCEGPELLRAFWKAIENVTVLDPTCGSGAFLFAALNILKPLYEACLDRMEGFVDDLDFLDKAGRKTADPKKIEDFRTVLQKVSQHPNHDYFVLKSIIVNNLFGVDIMEEAVEICKLRLFLKLVAQIERVEDLEPLPDIDFNIRSGNTLVGFTSIEEVKKSMEGDMVKLLELPRIEKEAEDVDQAFRIFQDMQLTAGTFPSVFVEYKQKYLQRLRKLSAELDRYLAGEYGISVPDCDAGFQPAEKKNADKIPQQTKEFIAWLKSHQPFHWFTEFYGIIKKGGFDVIIGNPPYVEYSKVKKEYTIRGYKTEECGNLYAFAMERSLELLHNHAHLGLIVPHSLAATYRIRTLQDLLIQRYDGAYSYFSRRPGKLFDGADQCLCIFIGRVAVSASLNISTTYHRWYTEARENLFGKMVYADSNLTEFWGQFEVFPKIGDPVEHAILQKISKQESLRKYLLEKGTEFYCHRISRYFIKAADFVPYFRSERDGIKRSDDYKMYFVDTLHNATLSVAALNSSTFYWFWRLMFDGYHCGKDNIASFPFDLSGVHPENAALLKALVQELMASFKGNAKRKSVQYRETGTVSYDEFNANLSKPIIDEIDCVLARHYGFTEEELDFIINYDIKYRMGRESEDT